MKLKRMFLALSLFLCAAYAAGQTSPSQDTKPASSQSTSEHETKVRGCVTGSAGHYAVTDKSGKSYQLLGDTSKVAEYVGHTVEVSGTVSSQSTGSSAATSPAAGAETQHRLEVSSAKDISPTCTSH